MQFAKLYYRSLQFSPAIPLAYALTHYGKLDAPLRHFVGYLTTSLILTIIMTVISLQGNNTLWLMNLSLPMYAAWILRMFSLWERSPRLRLAMNVAIALFVVVWSGEIILGGVLFEFTTYSRPILNVLFIGCACRTLFEANNDTEYPLLDQPRFWLSAGILFYFGGLMALNLASQSLLKSSQDSLFNALLLQPAVSLIAHLMYLAGFQAQCRR